MFRLVTIQVNSVYYLFRATDIDRFWPLADPKIGQISPV
jgi:hypothetical protein